MITYAFPPAAYVGGFRTLKYCKYLAQYGWITTVLTINAKDVAHKDEDLCREIPDYVNVYRTFDIDPAKWFARRSRKSVRTTPGTDLNTDDKKTTALRSNVLQRLKQAIRTLLTNSPDSHLFWVPFGVAKGIKILLKERINVIYCSSPPHSSHIIAFLIATMSRKPYVLDFRDPWLIKERPRENDLVNRCIARSEGFMKRVLVRNAARIICATRGEQNALRSEYPEIAESKITHITNGFDPVDFSASQISNNKSRKLILTHTGTIYSGTGDEFFESLQHLLKSDPGIGEKIAVNLLGDMADEYSETVRYLEKSGIVRSYGTQPHTAATRMMLESDVLLVLLGGNRFSSSVVPSKVYEYLYTEKPILAITSPGDLSNILEESGLGIIVSPRDIDTLTDTIKKLQVSHVSGQLTREPNRTYIHSFSRSVLTEKLAHVLNELDCASSGCSSSK